MITIIGNGESRKAIDISKIDGIKVGCNAIYLHENNKDIDYICAMDKFWRDKIAKECTIPLISRYHNNKFQTTLEIHQGGTWTNTQCFYRGYCSGITALDYMADTYGNIQPDKSIYLIGFDFNYKGDKINHVYKGTTNHPNANKQAQNEDVFLKQCIETVKRYPRINFYWVNNILVDDDNNSNSADNENKEDFLIKIRDVKLNILSIDEFKRLGYKNEYLEKTNR